MQPNAAKALAQQIKSGETAAHLDVTSPQIDPTLKGWTPELITGLLANGDFDSQWYGAEGTLASSKLNRLDEHGQPIYQHADTSMTSFPIPSHAINSVVDLGNGELAVVTDGRVFPMFNGKVSLMQYVSVYTVLQDDEGNLQVKISIQFKGIAALMHNQLSSFYTELMQAAMDRLANLLNTKSPQELGIGQAVEI